jgi:hypothetical protein
VAAVFEAAVNRLEAIHALCRRRIEQGEEEAIPLVVGMAAFEPAPDDWVADPATTPAAATANGSARDGVGEGEGAPSA